MSDQTMKEELIRRLAEDTDVLGFFNSMLQQKTEIDRLREELQENHEGWQRVVNDLRAENAELVGTIKNLSSQLRTALSKSDYWLSKFRAQQQGCFDIGSRAQELMHAADALAKLSAKDMLYMPDQETAPVSKQDDEKIAQVVKNLEGILSNA